MTTLLSVKNRIASRPWGCKSPKNESFVPLNGKYATGAATPTLIPMFPARAWCRKSRAAFPLRIDRGRVPVRASVDRLDRVVEATRLEERDHGPEDLRLRDAHVRSDVVQDRRSDEVAGVVSDPELASVEGDPSAFRLAPVDEPDDPVPVCARDHGAHA